MTTLAIIGPGAIGGTLATVLADNPDNQVTLCARAPLRSLTVTHAGQSETYTLKVATAPDAVRPVDWILLTTKTYQVRQAASTWFDALTGPGTQLAVIQNGVEHLANLAAHFDPERTLPVIIDCPVERLTSEQLVRHGNVRMTVSGTPAAEAFSNCFAHPDVSVAIDSDWTTAAWKKLCVNCAGAISVLVDQPANIAADPRAAAIMRSLISECVAVGRAEGATLSDTIADKVIASAAAAPEGSKNSLHADFSAGRPMEWDARNGVIARLGKKRGIATPSNDMAALLLALLESNYLAKD